MKASQAIIRFMQSEIAGGAVLFTAALVAIITANSEFLRPVYEHWLHADVGLIVGDWQFSLSLSHFINDGMMAVFFMLVGLEIKRELLCGELSNRSAALLPAIAAFGGMLAPALIYLAFNGSDALAIRGWAIPTATDIAFSLGVLSLLGSRVPLSVKIFLTAVAVIDDLGAIAIIALFYTSDLQIIPLILSGLTLFGLFLLNRFNIGARLPYMLGFLILWVFVLQSGVHATLAGVAAAFTIPLRTKNTPSLLETLESDLHPIITFFVLPAFAFANAGVNLSGVSLSSLLSPIPLGIASGLLLGKIIGVSTAVWLAVKSGIAHLPRGCPWSGIISISALCGIGFTVSLFIGNLAFDDNNELINAVKIGVLLGSCLAGIIGFLMLRLTNFHSNR